MKLFFEQVTDTNSIHYQNAIHIYEKSFPANERQPLSLIKERIEDRKSILFVALLNEDVVGMALLWYFSNSEFVLLDYMAVADIFRNQQIGSIFFKILFDKIKKESKYLILEVENYLFGLNSEQRIFRLNFYIRNGAYKMNDVPYILPSLDKSMPTEMLLLIAPEYNRDHIIKTEIEKLIIRLYAELYNKTENDILLSSMLKKIPDKITFSNKTIR